MSDLFLRSVELSNFRVYGDSYAFEFPPEPGITLIIGANGLGKTTFFDGVEYALTGEISRFSDIAVDGRRKELDPLTRIGAPPNSHRVSLAFSSGRPIDRGNGFVPSEAEIIELLKAPDWPRIDNLAGYLAITHLLGQAATRRFSVREPKTHWEALKGPAGVDKINFLRERLSGRGARQAFTRAINHRSVALQQANLALSDWGVRLEERARLRRLANSERSSSPVQVLQKLNEFASNLVRSAPKLSWVPVVGDEPEAGLERFSALIDQVKALRDAEDARLATLADVVETNGTTMAQIAATQSMLSEIEQRRKQLVGALEGAETDLTAAVTQKQAVDSTIAQVETRGTELLRAETASAALEYNNSLLQDIDGRVRQSRERLQEWKEKSDQAAANQEAANRLRAERNAVASQQTQARQRAEHSAALRVVRSEVNRLEASLAAVDAGALRASRIALEHHVRAADLAVTEAQERLRAHDAHVRSLAAAVAVIANELTEQDQSCPVCATRFEPGELLRHAREATAGSASATELAAALSEAQANHSELARQLNEVDQRIRELDQTTASLESERARAEELERKLVDAGGSPTAEYLVVDVSLFSERLREIDAAIATGPRQDELEGALSEALTAVAAEQAKLATLERERLDVANAAEAARAQLAQYPSLWDTVRGTLVSLAAERTKLAEELASLGKQQREAQDKLDECRIRRDTLMATIAREDGALAAANEILGKQIGLREELIARWQAAGQTGEPMDGALDPIRAHVVERTALLQSAEDVLQQLIAGLRLWRTDQSLQEHERAISQTMAAHAATEESAVTASLQAAVRAATSNLEQAQAARARMDRVSEQMQVRADEFAKSTLAPLNETIQRFAKPLMTWTDASIIYRADHTATSSELRPIIVRTDADGSVSPLEMNPNFFFSEGQLSALSVAALLAASTTFNWSRWHGLLLDDPLQHNDVIHASAFMDLLRQLVRQLGYQIILSSHDTSEAEFLVRKCRSSGIPFKVHELTPPGEEGLISDAA